MKLGPPRVTVRRVACGLTAAALVMATAACSGQHKTAASSDTSAKFSKSTQAACDAAANEDGGTLNYWTSTDPDVFQKEIAPFNQQYPNIKIKYTSLRPSDMVQRIISEVQAHHTLDVDAVAGDLPSFAPLFDQNLIQQVDWTALGIPADLQFTLKGVPTIRTYREVLGLGYNTKLVNASQLPSTWDELVDSKWSGKVIVDPRGVYLSGLGLALGQDQAVTFFKNLLKTDKPQIVKGATASLQKVVSGEAQLTTSSHDSEVAEQQSAGAPVAIKYLDIVPTQDWYAQIMKGSKHQDAAACFFSWWVGSAGAAQQLKYEFKSNATTPQGLPAGAKLAPINDPDQANLATAVADQFAKLMS